MKDNATYISEARNLLLKKLIAEVEKEGNLKLTLTVSQASNILGINKIRMYETVRSDGFPKIQLGNRILIPIIPFLEWIEKTAWDKAS